MLTRYLNRGYALKALSAILAWFVLQPGVGKADPCPPTQGWNGQYYNNPYLQGYPAMCRDDSYLEFNWSNGSPAPQLPNENFSVRWTRTAYFEAGNYLFQLHGDDGIRLFIDGNLIIDQWKIQADTRYEANYTLNAGNHHIRVEYYEASGLASVGLRWDLLNRTMAQPCPSIQNWKGEFWDNMNLSGQPVVCRDDAGPSFNWGTGSPDYRIPNDHFSARWTRDMFFQAGTYRFHMRGDDGIRLWIDGNLIIDQWKIQASTEYTNDYTLSQGYHNLRVEYFENEGYTDVALWWDQVQSFGACPPISAWKGEYWDNMQLAGNPVVCRNDADVRFNWDLQSPDNRIPNDHFSARWTRNMYFQAGTYRFHLRGDDGIRLWVDNNLIIDQWRDQVATEFTADFILNDGNHDFRIEYYENGGYTDAEFWWDRLQTYGQTTGQTSGSTCPPITDWQGEYWDNMQLAGNPVVCRNDANVSFNWGQGSPDPRIPVDHFSARWVRDIYLQSGIYRFHLRGDDGVRLFINESPLIDQWKDQNSTEYTADFFANPGNHRVRVEYYENGGFTDVAFWWEFLRPEL